MSRPRGGGRRPADITEFFDDYLLAGGAGREHRDGHPAGAAVPDGSSKAATAARRRTLGGAAVGVQLRARPADPLLRDARADRAILGRTVAAVAATADR